MVTFGVVRMIKYPHQSVKQRYNSQDRVTLPKIWRHARLLPAPCISLPCPLAPPPHLRMIYALTVLSVRDRQCRRSYGSDGWGRDLKATGAANIGEWDE